jgi:peroxiredoxin/N-acetylglutamate synthase-like GNAT family acetyltransferase
MHDPTQLPAGLPIPTDDGRVDHLVGSLLPNLTLTQSDGQPFDLAQFRTNPALAKAVLFFYPRTGVPGQPPSLGFSGEDWDTIPGARGCTPQSCSFRDDAAAFDRLGVRIFGVSTNTADHQAEFRQRMHIPFALLSDSSLQLTRTLNLPTFEFPVESGGPSTLIARMAWYVLRGRIHKVWYPVFPPQENAARVLSWLSQQPLIRAATAHDLSWIRDELHHHWHSTQISSRGKIYQADAIPAFVAERNGLPVGLVTYSFEPDGCEVVTLSSRSEKAGVGAALLASVEEAALAHGSSRVFLTTTNDNLHALGFYQRRGWSLAAFYKRGMDDARLIKPEIPVMGLNRIRLRDEIELELLLHFQ